MARYNLWNHPGKGVTPILVFRQFQTRQYQPKANHQSSFISCMNDKTLNSHVPSFWQHVRSDAMHAESLNVSLLPTGKYQLQTRSGRPRMFPRLLLSQLPGCPAAVLPMCLLLRGPFFITMMMSRLRQTAPKPSQWRAASTTFRSSKTKFLLNWYANPYHTPIFVAKENGWLTDEGLELAVLETQNPSDVTEIIGDGSVGLGLKAMIHILAAKDRQIDLKAFGTLLNEPPTGLLHCIPEPHPKPKHKS